MKTITLLQFRKGIPLILLMVFLLSGTLTYHHAYAVGDGGIQRVATPSLSIGTSSASPNEIVSVPITAQDFTTNVGAINLKIGYDPAKLIFLEIIDTQNLNNWGVAGGNGVLNISRIGSPGPIPFTNGELIRLKFKYIVGDADIFFKHGTEFTTTSNEPLTVLFTNGKVVPATPPARLIIGQVLAPENSRVYVPVTAQGFNPSSMIGSMDLKILFPAGKLIFRGLVSHQGFNGGVSHTQSQLRFLWNAGTGSGLPVNNGILFTLEFDYIAGIADLSFGFTEIYTTNFQLVQLLLTSGSVSVPPTGYKVSGTLKYANTDQTPLPNSTVELWNETGTIMLDFASTNNLGYYEIDGVISGNYILKASTAILPGGVNIDDLWDLYDFLDTGLPVLTGIFWLAGDFNQDGILDIDDLWDVFEFLTDGSTPTNYIPWVFENPAFNLNEADVSVNVKGLCSGDVNASFIPIP